MPNILDDIIASVVENKIPPNKASKINVKSEFKEEPKESRKSAMDENNKLYSDIPHSWICEKHILWLKDYKNTNNWGLIPVRHNVNLLPALFHLVLKVLF